MPLQVRHSDPVTEAVEKVGAAAYGAIVRDHWLLALAALAGIGVLVSLLPAMVLALEFTFVWLMFVVVLRWLRN